MKSIKLITSAFMKTLFTIGFLFCMIATPVFAQDKRYEYAREFGEKKVVVYYENPELVINVYDFKHSVVENIVATSKNSPIMVTDMLFNDEYFLMIYYDWDFCSAMGAQKINGKWTNRTWVNIGQIMFEPIPQYSPKILNEKQVQYMEDGKEIIIELDYQNRSFTKKKNE